MTTTPNVHPRTGRLTNQNFINALNRRYALIQGRYETIEQECEFVTGVAALIEAQDRVESEKVLMRRVMDAIDVVARHVDPDWTPGRVKPVYPSKRDNHTGHIARTALSVLRKQSRPMRIRELSRAALEAHGYKAPDEALVARYDRALHTSFRKKVGAVLGVEPGPPARYFIMAKPSSPARSADDR